MAEPQHEPEFSEQRPAGTTSSELGRGNGAARRSEAAEVMLVAIDGSPNAGPVTDAAARLAADDNG